MLCWVIWWSVVSCVSWMICVSIIVCFINLVVGYMIVGCFSGVVVV